MWYFESMHFVFRMSIYTRDFDYFTYTVSEEN